MTATDKTSSSAMNSVLSTLRVLEEVAARQPIGVSELARVTGIPKSSVQRCLVTLQQAGWLRIVDPERTRWGVTMKALAIGLRGAGEEDLRELARPVIKRLAADTDETVHFALRDGDDVIITLREDSTHAVRVFVEIGARLPLQATSAGVAILARLEPDEADEVLKRDVKGFPEPLPSTRELRKEIARTAERGYAVNMSAWYRPHVASIGAAVTSSAGRPIAAITLSIPELRFDPARESELAQLVVAAADEVSRQVSAV
ncbi:IclR family transcriptional regulator [Amycolatopsis pithecellobii]|uniref:Helix-turn-helix domain-containing protein n=1 Tax=Amycolatopsis pithecellobii TaxID=664692 RepID=A0A6N7Z364_9PSEU|nr:IclR family transcriptional regulator [Amycolatopsis pithecellobii]MTD54414.1 helix-turn-helix domain-containing protein [Amycolatopsis pithecellobii]